MSRFRPADLAAQARGEDGFSLTELLVAIVIGIVIIFGILQVLDTSFSLSRRTQQRIDSAQRGRLAMDLITRELRAQTCLSATEPALVSAADSDIVYYINLGAPDAVPEKHEIVLAVCADSFDALEAAVAEAETIESVTSRERGLRSGVVMGRSLLPRPCRAAPVSSRRPRRRCPRWHRVGHLATVR